ncbi:pyrokinin-1 receptor-like [Lycorma delicatula]|uniref:pyrokinin-1 receptor-like n=1 Tax=Lycorma delicatula TaxID=130591 RepID=UPI003F50D6C6
MLFPKRDPLYIVIPITILYSLILLTGVVGNIITCVVIARNRHMHTATNYYLFSLAVSDLLLLVSGLPQEMYYVWSRFPYVFGEAFCLLRGLAAETSANATVLTITAFTVERYVAICHPFLAHTMSKLSRAFRLILFIWVIALAFAIPQALQFGVIVGPQPDMTQCALKNVLLEHSFAFSTILFFLVPMTIITVLYALIGLRLRRSALLKKTSGSFSSHQENRKASCRHHSSQRVLKMLVAVVVAFFICWAPFHAQRLVAIYSSNGGSEDAFAVKLYTVVTYISGILYYVSTTVNPILYHIMSLKFREAFKDTLASCCCIKSRRRPYAMLSKRHRMLEGRNTKGAVAESLTDSGNSCAREDNTGKCRHTSQSSYVMNESENRPNIMLDLTVKTSKIGHLSWVPCITNTKKDFEDTRLGSESSHNRRLSLASNISNSSLKDVDRGALEDELTCYMKELARREQKQSYVQRFSNHE